MTRVVLMIVAGLAFAAFVELVIVQPAVRAAKARRAERQQAQGRPGESGEPGGERGLLGAAVPAPAADMFPGTELGTVLRRLAGYAQGYAGRTFADGTPIPEAVGAVVVRTQQLFERLARREDAQLTRLAETRYADMLGKVATIVAPTYLGDLLDHPELWPGAQERADRVAATLQDVAQQIIENIRQVNTSADLDFEVALSSLSEITRDDEFRHLYLGAPRTGAP